jgi:hypothetical protein
MSRIQLHTYGHKYNYIQTNTLKGTHALTYIEADIVTHRQTHKKDHIYLQTVRKM